MWDRAAVNSNIRLHCFSTNLGMSHRRRRFVGRLINQYSILSRVYTRQHVARHVAVNMLLVAVNKIVASLLPVCCWIHTAVDSLHTGYIGIQVDRDIGINELPRYRQHHNILPERATCYRATCCLNRPWSRDQRMAVCLSLGPGLHIA